MTEGRTPPAPAPRPRQVRASPWPFVGMGGMAVVFFLYAASGLVAPPWAVAVLLVFWAALLLVAFRWWTPHPKRLIALPLVAAVVWVAAISAGGFLLDWSA